MSVYLLYIKLTVFANNKVGEFVQQYMYELKQQISAIWNNGSG